MNNLTIGIHQLRELVTPVLPFAGSDDMLPVLCAVRIEAHGPWLTATATDRFRLAVQRVKAPEGTWPEWSATVPLSTLRSLLRTFRPQRGMDSQVSLSIDGDLLRVVSAGALIDMDDAAITYPLERGQFPGVHSIIRKALAAETVAGAHTAVNPKFLAAMPVGHQAIRIKVSAPNEPVPFTDGEDFICIVMPRRVVGGATPSEAAGFPPMPDGWTKILAEPKKATAKKAPAKKAAARKTSKVKAAVA